MSGHYTMLLPRCFRCYSPVGRQYTGSGMQEVSIGPNCESVGIVMHELMHAIGFYHEQSRYDRDKYVMVRWKNIANGKISRLIETTGHINLYDKEPKRHSFSGYSRNFNRGNFNEVDLLGIPYDLNSLMHYENYELSGNKFPTIQSILYHNYKIGQRTGFTNFDVMKINALYRCAGMTLECILAS